MSTFERMRWSGMSGDVLWTWVLLHSTRNYSKDVESSQFPLMARSSLFSDKLQWDSMRLIMVNHQHKCRRDIGVTSPHSSCSSLAEMLLWAKMGSWHQSLDVTKTPIPKTLHRSLSCPVYSKPSTEVEELHIFTCLSKRFHLPDGLRLPEAILEWMKWWWCCVSSILILI